MEEAKNEYKIDFGPYSVELKGSQVYFRKNNSLVKAIPASLIPKSKCSSLASHVWVKPLLVEPIKSFAL